MRLPAGSKHQYIALLVIRRSIWCTSLAQTSSMQHVRRLMQRLAAMPNLPFAVMSFQRSV